MLVEIDLLPERVMQLWKLVRRFTFSVVACKVYDVSAMSTFLIQISLNGDKSHLQEMHQSLVGVTLRH
jgi:hypothetical protein